MKIVSLVFLASVLLICPQAPQESAELKEAETARVAHCLFNLGEFDRAEKDFERGASSYRRSLMVYGSF